MQCASLHHSYLRYHIMLSAVHNNDTFAHGEWSSVERIKTKDVFMPTGAV